MLDLAYSIYYFKKRATLSEARRHRAWLDILFLLISIPYLNILGWLHITPGRDIAMLVATLPIIRSYIVMGMVVQWLLDGAVAKVVKLVVYVYFIVVEHQRCAICHSNYREQICSENLGNSTI